MATRRSDDGRQRQRRQQLAQEAARLLAEGLHGDVAEARRKAAAKLGVREEAALPSGDEIREALLAHQRLFGSEPPGLVLRQLREAAVQAMAFFRAYEPRLAGPVFDGSAQAGAGVILHLHADDPDSLARLLMDQGIPAQQGRRRLRLDTDTRLDCPAWHFEADGIAFELVLLPLASLRQAPLDPLDGKPMARASITALRRLLDA